MFRRQTDPSCGDVRTASFYPARRGAPYEGRAPMRDPSVESSGPVRTRKLTCRGTRPAAWDGLRPSCVSCCKISPAQNAPPFARFNRFAACAKSTRVELAGNSFSACCSHAKAMKSSSCPSRVTVWASAKPRSASAISLVALMASAFSCGVTFPPKVGILRASSQTSMRLPPAPSSCQEGRAANIF